jgi:hypothetical protein
MRTSPIEIAFPKSYLVFMSGFRCGIGAHSPGTIGDPIQRVQLY